jgi:hypothetical protein
MSDIYDGTEWTEMDIEDLKSAIAYSRSLEEIAEFLCRSTDDVARKCTELGLTPGQKAFLDHRAVWEGDLNLGRPPASEETEGRLVVGCAPLRGSAPNNSKRLP